LSDQWFDQRREGFFRKPVDLVPVLLAVGVCVALISAWLSFSGGGFYEVSEVEGFSNTSFDGENVGASVSGHSASAEGVIFNSGPSLSGLFTPEVLYWRDKILEWSAIYSVDPNIVATIMQIESCGHPGAVSGAGARGLFQVMPFHFDASEDMLEPDTNAMRGMLFFREQMRYTGDDILLSFAGYNGGYAASGGAYQSWPNETQRYYYWAQGIYEDASSGNEASSRLDEWLAAGGASGCRVAAQSLGL
jgi:hypothetical protein